MCIGCDIGHLGPYLEFLDGGYLPATEKMRDTERKLLGVLALELAPDHRNILDKHHKNLVRIRRDWARANQEMALEFNVLRASLPGLFAEPNS